MDAEISVLLLLALARRDFSVQGAARMLFEGECGRAIVCLPGSHSTCKARELSRTDQHLHRRLIDSPHCNSACLQQSSGLHVQDLCCSQPPKLDAGANFIVAMKAKNLLPSLKNIAVLLVLAAPLRQASEQPSLTGHVWASFHVFMLVLMVDHPRNHILPHNLSCYTLNIAKGTGLAAWIEDSA